MKYLLNIIGIARYNKIHYTEGDKDKRISYCKNRGLIYAIALIGHWYVVDPKKSAYKNGIIYLQKVINGVKGQRYISKEEIKTAMRPYRKRKHSLKIPIDIEIIVKNTIEIIHSMPALHKQCVEMNHVYAEQNKVNHLHCYRFLIGPLIKHLDIIHGAIDEKAPIKDLYNSLTDYHRLCKL